MSAGDASTSSVHVTKSDTEESRTEEEGENDPKLQSRKPENISGTNFIKRNIEVT